MRIIGLTGVARAGKDTCAQIIQHHYTGKKVIRQGFADQLKLSATRLFDPGCTTSQGIEFCEWLKHDGVLVVYQEGQQPGVKITGRQFLQRYGTEAHREVFGKDFWLDAVLPLNQITFGLGGGDELSRDDCDVLVIPDVRFENEAERVRYVKGEVWLVRRPNAEPVEFHSSELGVPLDMVTKIIDNTGTLDDLERVVIRELKGKVGTNA